MSHAPHLTQAGPMRLYEPTIGDAVCGCGKFCLPNGELWVCPEGHCSAPLELSMDEGEVLAPW